MSEYDIVLRGGTVVTAAERFRGDVAIAGGRIAAVGERLSGRQAIDAADAALHVSLAGLVTPRRETEMGADIARPPEAVWLVDRGAERQRGQRADAGHRHQPAACRLNLHLVEHAFG